MDMSVASGAGARILVVTALPEECAAFSGKRLPPGTVVAASGDGPRRAARGVAALCKRHQPALLIGAGVAGGLTPDLGVGDLVVAQRVLDERGEAPAPHAPLTAAAAAKPGAQAGTLLSLDQPLVSAAEKAQWAARVGPPPAAVDMESAAWARAAAAHGVPFLIVRIVSDTAEEDLPGYLSSCMRSEGGIGRTRVALAALLNPGTIPTLWHLRRRVADCAGRLADFVAHVAAELEGVR
jgi:nucleoside phosphorylase